PEDLHLLEERLPFLRGRLLPGAAIGNRDGWRRVFDSALARIGLQDLRRDATLEILRHRQAEPVQEQRCDVQQSEWILGGAAAEIASVGDEDAVWAALPIGLRPRDDDVARLQDGDEAAVAQPQGHVGRRLDVGRALQLVEVDAVEDGAAVTLVAEL